MGTWEGAAHRNTAKKGNEHHIIARKVNETHVTTTHFFRAMVVHQHLK